MWSAVKRILERLVFMLFKAHRHLPVPEAFETAAANIRVKLRELRDFDPHSRDCTYVMQRLIACAPFGARDVRETVPMRGNTAPALPLPARTDMPLALAVGSLLDATILPRHHLRQPANVWTQWAVHSIMQLAGLYACACAPLDVGTEPPKVKPPPCPRCRTREAARHQVGPLGWEETSEVDSSDDDDGDSVDTDGASDA